MHVERFARAKAGSAVEVPYGIGDGAVAVYCTRSGGEIDAVKEVEHVGAELSLHTLAEQRDVLQDREIDAAEARTVELVATDILRACSVRGGVDPLDSGARATRQILGEAMRDALEGIADQVQSDCIGEHLIVRLTGVEVPQTADLPAVSKDLRTMRRAWHVIGEGGRDQVTSVKIGAAVVGFEIRGIV